MSSTTPRHPAKKPLMIVTGIAALVLTLAVLAGAGNAVVYPVAAVLLASTGVLIYLIQNQNAKN